MLTRAPHFLASCSVQARHSLCGKNRKSKENYLNSLPRQFRINKSVNREVNDGKHTLSSTRSLGGNMNVYEKKRNISRKRINTGYENK